MDEVKHDTTLRGVTARSLEGEALTSAINAASDSLHAGHWQRIDRTFAGAYELLTAHWPEVRAVALALLRRVRLAGDEVEALRALRRGPEQESIVRASWIFCPITGAMTIPGSARGQQEANGEEGDGDRHVATPAPFEVRRSYAN